MRGFVGFGGNLEEFEPRVLRTEPELHTDVFEVHLAGIPARSG